MVNLLINEQNKIKEDLEIIIQDEKLLNKLIKVFEYLLLENDEYLAVINRRSLKIEQSLNLIEKLMSYLEKKEVIKCIEIIKELRGLPIFYPITFKKNFISNISYSSKLVELKLELVVLELIDTFRKLKEIINWLEKNLNNKKIKERIIFYLQYFETNLHFLNYNEELENAQEETQKIMFKLLKNIKNNDLKSFKKNIVDLVFYPAPTYPVGRYNGEEFVYDYFITFINYLCFVIENIKKGKKIITLSEFFEQYEQKMFYKLKNPLTTEKLIKMINREITKLLNTKKGEKVIKELAEIAYNYYLATKNIEAFNISVRLNKYLSFKKVGRKTDIFKMFNDYLTLVTKNNRLIEGLEAKKYLLKLLKK